MLAVFINAAAVLIGGLIGSLLGNRIPGNYTKGIMVAMALVTFGIGVQSFLQTQNILIVVLCMVLGTILGTFLRLDDRISSAADSIKKRLSGTKIGQGHFTEAFVTTSVLFCVGTMTVIGSIRAGLDHDYSILLTKSVMDFFSSIAFSAALGAGVLFSAVTVVVIQGGLALLAGVAAPLMSAEVIAEMSAVGGPIFIGMAINLLQLRQEKLKVGDMLPGIFLPILYFALAGLFSK